MPDLTIHPFYFCPSTKTSVKIQSSRGNKTYSVYRGRTHQYDFDWVCTCPAYKYKNGECKHIKLVKVQACTWDQFVDGGEAIENKCPQCGVEVEARMVGC